MKNVLDRIRILVLLVLKIIIWKTLLLLFLSVWSVLLNVRNVVMLVLVLRVQKGTIWMEFSVNNVSILVKIVKEMRVIVMNVRIWIIE